MSSRRPLSVFVASASAFMPKLVHAVAARLRDSLQALPPLYALQNAQSVVRILAPITSAVAETVSAP